jgi:hypothetical protein
MGSNARTAEAARQKRKNEVDKILSEVLRMNEG